MAQFEHRGKNSIFRPVYDTAMKAAIYDFLKVTVGLLYLLIPLCSVTAILYFVLTEQWAAAIFWILAKNELKAWVLTLVQRIEQRVAPSD